MKREYATLDMLAGVLMAEGKTRVPWDVSELVSSAAREFLTMMTYLDDIRATDLTRTLTAILLAVYTLGRLSNEQMTKGDNDETW